MLSLHLKKTCVSSHQKSDPVMAPVCSACDSVSSCLAIRPGQLFDLVLSFLRRDRHNVLDFGWLALWRDWILDIGTVMMRNHKQSDISYSLHLTT